MEKERFEEWHGLEKMSLFNLTATFLSSHMESSYNSTLINILISFSSARIPLSPNFIPLH